MRPESVKMVLVKSRWALPIAGVAAIAAVGGYFLIIDDPDEDDGGAGSGGATVVAPAADVGADRVEVVYAEPHSGKGDLALTAGDAAEGKATFEADWSNDGRGVSGELVLQRMAGRDWTKVGIIETTDGSGNADVDVPSSGIYRLAYGGSNKVDAITSADVGVTSGPLMKSHLITTIDRKSTDSAIVTAGWTTTAGVPIVGDLVLQSKDGGEWKKVADVVTKDDGTAKEKVKFSDTTKYRFVYKGGSRFAPVESEPGTLAGDDIKAIPVTDCDSDAQIDSLGYGAACHYTPVSVGTFVVGHDYLGNAWWNSLPEGGMVELTGSNAGLYEVVNRVMAPSRGSDLGPASNWACGDDCDVILQTCQGNNTGFTWLRKA